MSWQQVVVFGMLLAACTVLAVTGAAELAGWFGGAATGMIAPMGARVMMNGINGRGRREKGDPNGAGSSGSSGSNG